MARMHQDRRYRSMQLRRGIKPVMRLSNMTAERTAEELAWFRAAGFHAEPCHSGYNFDENHLYRFSENKGELFYIFVSPERSRIDEILAFDREEKAGGSDSAEATRGIGRLLGYPRCCTDYHLSFSGVPHQSSFLLRPLHTTKGAIGPGIHPTMRLLGHFFCSLECPTTIDVHRRIVEALADELPEHLEFVRPGLRMPVMLVEWDMAVTFEGEARGNTVDYSAVTWHALSTDQHPSAEHLKTLLQSGDRCVLRDSELEVFRSGRSIGIHDTRPFGLPPIWFPMDGQPIGKVHHQVAVLRPESVREGSELDRSIRLTAGDLAHRGYKAELVQVGAVPHPEALRSLGFTMAVAAPEHLHLAADLPVVPAGDRHDTVRAVDAVSLGRECPPVAPRGGSDAHRRMWWPSPFLRVPGKHHLTHLRALQVCDAPPPFPIETDAEPDDSSERRAFVHRQLTRHVAVDDGTIAVLPLSLAADRDHFAQAFDGKLAIVVAGQALPESPAAAPEPQPTDPSLARVLQTLTGRIRTPPLDLDGLEPLGRGHRIRLVHAGSPTPVVLWEGPDTPEVRGHRLVRWQDRALIWQSDRKPSPEEIRWCVALVKLLRKDRRQQ